MYIIANKGNSVGICKLIYKWPKPNPAIDEKNVVLKSYYLKLKVSLLEIWCYYIKGYPYTLLA